MIIDEAQNLTNSQIKMLLTRVGAGTKVVMLGNVKQIDHPYLSASSNGMVHVMERFSDSKLFGAIELIETVRSPLAEEAVNRLHG
jgi:PhoH-like ATPase